MKMGLHVTKLNADSKKCSEAKTPECTTNCERLVIDGLSQTKFETVEKIVKDLFQWDLENMPKKDKNHLEEPDCLKKVDFNLNFEKSTSGNTMKCMLEELLKIPGSIKTCVSKKEALILTSACLPNLMSNSDSLRGDMQFNSDKTVKGEIIYKWPIHGHSLKPNLNLTLSYKKKKPVDLGFQVEQQGISCGVDFQPYQNIQQFLNWEGVLRHQTGHGLMSMLARANCGYSLKSSLKHTAVFDDRDVVLFPTKGSRIELTTEVSGLGGNISYLKNNLQMQHFFSLPKDLIVETRFGCGLLNPFNCESKYMDTFTLGGPWSVRGFQTNGIDPKNDCVSSYWVGNIHLYLPFIMKAQNCDSSIISDYHTQFFVNSGNLGSGNNCFKKEIADLMHEFRISCGVGLIVSIKALGRIEVNYCIPLRQQEDDRTVTGLQLGIQFDFL